MRWIPVAFGPWTTLAEHDITDETIKTGSLITLGQVPYWQIFWAVREWLVPSLIVERLRVDLSTGEP